MYEFFTTSQFWKINNKQEIRRIAWGIKNAQRK